KPGLGVPLTRAHHRGGCLVQTPQGSIRPFLRGKLLLLLQVAWNRRGRRLATMSTLSPRSPFPVTTERTSLSRVATTPQPALLVTVKFFPTSLRPAMVAGGRFKPQMPSVFGGLKPNPVPVTVRFLANTTPPGDATAEAPLFSRLRSSTVSDGRRTG